MDRIAMRVQRLRRNARIATKSRKGVESPIAPLATDGHRDAGEANVVAPGPEAVKLQAYVAPLASIETE